MKNVRAAVCWSLIIGGCSADETWDLPPIQYESRRTEIGLGGSFAHHELCPADLERLDRHVEFIEERLGVRRDEPVTVYLLDSEGWGPPQCSDEAFGCYIGDLDAAFSSYWFAVEHEIVHAVTREIRFPSTFWKEGTASMLPGDWTRRDPGYVLTADGLQADSLVNYVTAAHFCRFLVETRGWEKFARAIRGESLDSIYGETAEALTEEYEREAPFSYPPLESCPHSALPRLGDDSWGGELTLSCADSAATGMNWEPRPAVRRTIELEAGTYALRVRGGVSYSLVGCHTQVLDVEPEPPSNGDVPNEIDDPWHDGNEFQPAGVQLLDLTEGLYRISSFGSHRFVLETEISIRRVDWSFDEDPPAQRED